MNLTSTEKLILTMLADISEKLDASNLNDIDPAFIKTAISSGHTWALGWKYPDYSDGTTNPPEVIEVVDIMNMWSALEVSYNRLDDIKGTLKFHNFFGFDGNNEIEYYSIANFLINHLDRFSTFKGRVENTHMPRLETYRRMLKIYETYPHSCLLNAAQIQALLNLM